MYVAGRHFLTSFAWLAQYSHQSKLARFALVPKIHMYWHLNHRLKEEMRTAEFIFNPMTASCAMDEDFIGRFCALTRAVSPRARVKRAMERYFTHIFLQWRRAAREEYEEGF